MTVRRGEIPPIPDLPTDAEHSEFMARVNAMAKRAEGRGAWRDHENKPHAAMPLPDKMKADFLAGDHEKHVAAMAVKKVAVTKRPTEIAQAVVEPEVKPEAELTPPTANEPTMTMTEGGGQTFTGLQFDHDPDDPYGEINRRGSSYARGKKKI